MSKGRRLTAAMFALSDYVAIAIIGLSVLGFLAFPISLAVFSAYELPGQRPGMFEILSIMAGFAVAAISAMLHRRWEVVCLLLFCILVVGLLVAQNIIVTLILFLVFGPPWLLAYFESR